MNPTAHSQALPVGLGIVGVVALIGYSALHFFAAAEMILLSCYGRAKRSGEGRVLFGCCLWAKFGVLETITQETAQSRLV